MNFFKEYIHKTQWVQEVFILIFIKKLKFVKVQFWSKENL